jgi:hypothetical protein
VLRSGDKLASRVSVCVCEPKDFHPVSQPARVLELDSLMLPAGSRARSIRVSRRRNNIINLTAAALSAVGA